MKKVLLATSALAATAGFATAQGVSVTGTAQMGVLGGDWVDDPTTDDTSYELHTDIDVHFTMSGETDTGLTFGASIDLDESDGSNSPIEGASPAFAGRTEGGETIFISGGFGTLTMGDTDGALDWALQEIAIGGTLGDAHTTHAGYSGNGIADAEQVARYDYSFGDFGVAISANISDDASYDDILAVGAKYNASLAAMELGVGVGYTQLGHDREEDDAIGVSLDADFNNGFRAILNWVDMGDSYVNLGSGADEQYIGVGLGYTVGDWTVAANWGKYSEEDALLSQAINPADNLAGDRGQSGYALVVNYDLGGGADVQLGYTRSDCETRQRQVGQFQVTIEEPVISGADCQGDTRISLGVNMSF